MRARRCVSITAFPGRRTPSRRRGFRRLSGSRLQCFAATNRSRASSWVASTLASIHWRVSCGEHEPDSHSGHRDAFAERDLWNGYRPNLLRFDIRRADHLGPLLGIFDDELAELGRRVCKRLHAQIGEPRFEHPISKCAINLLSADRGIPFGVPVASSTMMVWSPLRSVGSKIRTGPTLPIEAVL